MDVTRRQFLKGILLGALTLVFGKFLNIFGRSEEDTVARYWRKGDKLAG